MNDRKKAYRKPVLERILLIPNENVLGVCSTGSPTSGIYENPICDQGLSGGCYGETLFSS